MELQEALEILHIVKSTLWAMPEIFPTILLARK